jgi:hypothetical protein
VGRTVLAIEWSSGLDIARNQLLAARVSFNATPILNERDQYQVVTLRLK